MRLSDGHMSENRRTVRLETQKRETICFQRETLALEGAVPESMQL